MTPTLSIALATYNGEAFLGEQLASLAAQTVLPVELVVTDDNSGDDTVGILRDFAARAPFPVQIVQNGRRLGYRANFLKAASLCAGDLIAFCDQDDVWETHKLETMAAAFADPGVLLAFHNAAVIDANGRLTGALRRRSAGVTRFGARGLRPFRIVPGFTQVFRRDLLAFGDLHPLARDIDAPGEPLPHDRWFLFLASALGIVVELHERLARYRLHGANTYGLHRDWRVGFHRLFLRGRRFETVVADAAKARAAILEAIASRVCADQVVRAEEAAAFYRALAARHAARGQWRPF